MASVGSPVMAGTMAPGIVPGLTTAPAGVAVTANPLVNPGKSARICLKKLVMVVSVCILHYE